VGHYVPTIGCHASDHRNKCPVIAVVRLGTFFAYVANMENAGWTPADLAVAREILSYLAERPGNRDSIKSVAEWWVRRRRLEEALTTIERVLQHLADDSLVLEYDNPPAFGLNQQCYDEVLRFLEGKQSPDPPAQLSE
jgi:hypothetical protein